MTRFVRWFGFLLAVPVLLSLGAGRSAAQVVVVGAPPVVSYYYAPPTVSYYPPPAVSYYAPPAVSYYTPPAVVAPTTTVTTYGYGLLPRRRVTVTTYGASAVAAPLPAVRYYPPVYVAPY